MPNPLAGQTFPFDPTGTARTNLVQNEHHTVTRANWRRYHFLVPRKGPYFSESLRVVHRGTSGSPRTLTFGQDYVYSFYFAGASRALKKGVYGGVSLLNADLEGTFTLQYQNLGGEWVLDEGEIEAILGQALHNPLLTTWEVVAEVPKLFAPEPHPQDVNDFINMGDVNRALHSIAVAIASKGGAGGNSAQFSQHAGNTDNPHHTNKHHVGLGSVRNLPTLPLSDVTNNTNDYYTTPASVRLIIANAVGDAFRTWTARRDNPSGVTATQTGAYTKQEANALLASKLSRTDVAFDTQRFNGRNYEETKADFLTGTAANTVLFNGRNYQSLVNDVAQELATTQTFGGMNPEDYKADVLSGKAANATLFNGRNEAQYAQWLSEEGEVNAKSFNGKDEAAWETKISQMTVANAERFNGYNWPEMLKALEAANVDADTLQGFTVSDIVSASNRNVLEVFGKNESQLKADFLSGTAANARKFDDKTAEEWEARFSKLTSANALKVFGYDYPQLVSSVAQEVQLVVGNANTFQGRDFEQARIEILRGKAADSALLNGESKEDILNEVYSFSRPLLQQKRIIPAAVGTTPQSFRYYEFMRIQESALTDDNKDTAVSFDVVGALYTREDGAGTSDVTARFTLDLSQTSQINQAVKVEFIPLNGSVITPEVHSRLQSQIGLYFTRELTGRVVTLYLKINKRHRQVLINEICLYPTLTPLLDEVSEASEVSMTPNQAITLTFVPLPRTSQGGVSTQVVTEAIEEFKTTHFDPLASGLNTYKDSVRTTISDAFEQQRQLDVNTYATKGSVETLRQSSANQAKELNRLKSGDVLRNLTLGERNTVELHFENGAGFAYTTDTEAGDLNFTFKPRTYVGTHEMSNASGVVQRGYLLLDYRGDKVIRWGNNAQFPNGTAPVFQKGKRYLLEIRAFSFTDNTDVFGKVLVELISEV